MTSGLLLRATYGEIAPDERRAKMLKAAMIVVARNDVTNATMDRIADQAGVSRVTLYREFGNRSSLFEAVIAYRLMLFDRRFFERTALPQSFSDLLGAYLQASTRVSLRNPVTRRWVTGGLSFLREGSQIHRVAVATWSPILEHYRQNGAMRKSVNALDMVLWINILQYSFSRLTVETDISQTKVHKIVQDFVLPAFIDAQGDILASEAP